MDKIQKIIFESLVYSSKQLLKMQQKKEVYKKSLRDLVTSADFLSQKIIIKQIKKNFSDHKIYSEENIGNKEDLFAKNCWIVDPLDGTNNYAYGLDLWGVSIAYAKNSILEYGAISYPKLQTILFAKKDAGAYEYKIVKNTIKKIRKIQVSNRELNQAMVLACYAQGENLANTFQKLEQLHKNVFHIRHLGAAVFELGYVAQGYADAAVLFRIKPYDIAAGALLIQEAGGKVSKIDGSPYTLDSTSFVAANKKIHWQLIQVLNKG
ncbi:MAG: inositol monophosphatase [Candidatus Micrarchaeota archaeon]|nr:inositol monophosphatase [Candidatus Micrarchaeota archaeon]